MLLDLADIEAGAQSFGFTISRDDLVFEDTRFRLTSDVTVSGEVVRHIAQVDVTGAVRGSAEIECTRCLKPVAWPVSIDFTAGFVPAEYFASSKEHEVSAGDLDVDALEEDRIDLKLVVREQILLNLPEQAFCGPDCKGLCPQCGTDLNLLDCKCENDQTDPRWAALKNLK